MAAMSQLRDRSAVILIVLLVLFVLSMAVGGLVGGADIIDIITGKNPNTIGVINGTEITYTQFNQAYINELDAYRQRTGDEPAESQAGFVRNQVWEGFVQDVLVQEAIQEKGLAVTDDEIVWRIYNAPPDILKSNPSFQNDQKQFDMAKYQSYLNDPSTADQWRPIEEYLRQTLPYEKFQQQLQAGIRITESEIKREYLKQNQTVKVNYVFIDPQKVADKDIEIDDDLIGDYYKNNKEEFKEEEKRQIQYVIFPTTATAKDSSEIRALADDILQRIQDGDDFGELAEIYSEDPGSKDKGGVLGFFAKGVMVKAFEDAAFSGKPGEIVGPVQTQHGLHIIKVEEKKTENGEEKVNARHILFNFAASRKTLDKARDDAEYFAEQAKELPFEELSKNIGRTPQGSTFFVKGNGFVPGIGLNKRASDFIFSGNIGEAGDVVQSPQGLFVFKISGIQNERTKPLDEVSTIIKSKLKIEKQNDLAAKKAQEVYEKINSGSSFEAVASEDSLEIKESTDFSRSGYIAGVGREPKFIGAAFSLPNSGDVSRPVLATRGCYLIQLVDKKAFDEPDFNTSKNQIASQLLQRKKGQVFAIWYAEAKAKADIKDNRSRFF